MGAIPSSEMPGNKQLNARTLVALDPLPRGASYRLQGVRPVGISHFKCEKSLLSV